MPLPDCTVPTTPNGPELAEPPSSKAFMVKPAGPSNFCDLVPAQALNPWPA